MLTRIYIDNFRCFVNFEYKPARQQLILGANGSGKSSLLDALIFLRRVVLFGKDPERLEILSRRTRWMDLPNQTFELEASVNGVSYIYRLVIDSYGNPTRARVQSESLKSNGKLIFRFEDGRVHLFDDQLQQVVAYPFDPHRSAIATISEERVNQSLAQFKQWFSQLVCIRINPFLIGHQAKREHDRPFFDLSNFGAWYRHLVLAEPEENAKLRESLRAALDDFAFLKLERAGDAYLLLAEFARGKSPGVDLRFDELSDGQRCLICLYSILHFVLAKGRTAILDEPDNFISLREIQPWLNAVSDTISESRGQIIIVSHHPEMLDQWAPAYGVRFVREGMGPVRVKKFQGELDSPLSPSELIARGWENE
ncbi:MAG TPA: ATP-binding protein [Candidatus Saccharimonadales bacterium]|jgi:energy-coupling factor transporter ATP-binding protein EcfA2|nr:ATP-binding protein [Candidatus Saccharimonadales bacterium]